MIYAQMQYFMQYNFKPSVNYINYLADIAGVFCQSVNIVWIL